MEILRLVVARTVRREWEKGGMNDHTEWRGARASRITEEKGARHSLRVAERRERWWGRDTDAATAITHYTYAIVFFYRRLALLVADDRVISLLL